MEHYSQVFPFGNFYQPQPPLFINPASFPINNVIFNDKPLQKNKESSETAFSQLQSKYDKVLKEKKELQKRLENALSLIERSRISTAPKRKVIRRKQDQLDKKHRCCYGTCKKEYASILALNLHIKTKHGGGTKKQRDDLAKQILVAQLKGLEAPQITINLPEGYVQKYKKQQFLITSTNEQKFSEQI